MLNTVTNAGTVLDLFTTEHPEHGVTEVARALGMSKSRAHALLTTLASSGLLRRTADRRYRLGWRILEMNRVLTETTEFKSEAYDAMARLAACSAETVHLATLDEGHVMYVDKLEGPRAVSIPPSTVGAQLPAHCSALGKVLLADRSPEEVEAIICRHGLTRFTSQTITTPEGLAIELAEVRRLGYARDRGEAVEGLECVAAPIFDATGVAVAALSISGPAARLVPQLDVFRRLVTYAGRGVSARLRRGAAPAPL
jgi:DNA-binding IclR family transcriptional regulator